MSNELRMMLDQLRGYQMTPAEREEQMISFAYGNAALENPAVTREMVRQVFEQMKREEHRDRGRETQPG